MSMCISELGRGGGGGEGSTGKSFRFVYSCARSCFQVKFDKTWRLGCSLFQFPPPPFITFASGLTSLGKSLERILMIAAILTVAAFIQTARLR